VIDANRIIRWSYLSPVGINPGANGILTALERLAQQEPMLVVDGDADRIAPLAARSTRVAEMVKENRTSRQSHVTEG
jgi:hypothetical protein